MTAPPREPGRYTVLVTGAAGHIGAAVCDRLLRRGHRVRGFDRAAMPALDDAVVGDLCEQGDVERAVDGLGPGDVAVHLAANPSTRASFPDQLLGPNVLGPWWVLQAAAEGSAEDATRRVPLSEATRLLLPALAAGEHEEAEALFEEWEHEIGVLENASYRRQSEQSLRETKRRYSQLVEAMKKAAASMDPVLSKLRDQVLFLKHNLNAQALGSLEGEASTLQADVSRLIVEMQASIAEADRFIDSMKKKPQAAG